MKGPSVGADRRGRACPGPLSVRSRDTETEPPRRRKRIRLPSRIYEEPGRIFSVTIATSKRIPIFADLHFGVLCVDVLRALAQETQTRIYAYCLMPDHAHLLVGIGGSVALPSFVGSWKSLCYRAWRKKGGRATLWQRSYYDHALRADDDVWKAASYVLNNPVRDGLAKDFHDYSLAGSFEFALSQSTSSH